MNYQIANKQFGNVTAELLQTVNYGTHSQWTVIGINSTTSDIPKVL